MIICNDCDWQGELEDCVYLGHIGPLCPNCHETTYEEKNMRNVNVFEHVKTDGCWVLELKCQAKFHAFGVDFEQFDFGIGNYSVAIVEYADGTIETIPAEHIKFID